MICFHCGGHFSHQDFFNGNSVWTYFPQTREHFYAHSKCWDEYGHPVPYPEATYFFGFEHVEREDV